MQEVRAILKDARLSAQKARLVTDQIRKLKVEDALNLLTFSPKKAARIIKKVLESAMANAEHNEGLDIDELFISSVFVDEAAKLRRFSPRAKGRANRIIKHGCHITVVVAPKQTTKKKAISKTSVTKSSSKKETSKETKKETRSKKEPRQAAGKE